MLRTAAATGATLLGATALVLAMGLSSCGASTDGDAHEPAMTPSSAPTTTPTPAATKPSPPVTVGGLTVRYLDDEGEISTLNVEDFQR